jgi:alpha,alpha-trehalase
MYEKMDASRPGERGGGGEYTPQEGFGWSNGVVLGLLAQGYLPGVTRE